NIRLQRMSWDRGKARYAQHVQPALDRACLPRMSCRLEELAQKQASFRRFAPMTCVRVAFRFRHRSTADRAGLRSTEVRRSLCTIPGKILLSDFYREEV